MAQTVILRGKPQRDYAHVQIDAAPDDARVIITEAKEQRTDQQNRTLHMWFGEIARQSDDLDAFDIKGICHREFGLTIKMRDPKFAWVWKRSGANLSYEKQCALLASGVFNVSSSMSVEELSEYMEAMQRRYRTRGFTLTDPEARKYEQEFSS